VANKLSQQAKANELPKKLKCQSEQKPINDNTILKALKKFHISQKNAQKIISDYSVVEQQEDSNNSKQEEQGIAKIKQFLGDENNLQSCVIKNNCSKDKEIEYKETWIKKLYSYQQDNKIEPTGILNEKTFKIMDQNITKEIDTPNY